MSGRQLSSHEEPPRTQAIAFHPNVIDYKDDDTDESEDLFPPNAPTHLLQLFDDILLDSNGHDPNHGISAPSKHSMSPQVMQSCAALQALTPSHADMRTIAAYATSWLPLYACLFPISNTNMTPEAMLTLHSELQHHDDPVSLAILLLYIAMTVQHAPVTANFPTSENMQNLERFIKNVSDTVEHVVIADDVLAGTIKGIEASLLFLRLQLGRVKVTKMWVLSRRVIALTELLGLPRAATALASLKSREPPSSAPHISSLKQRAQVWESICAIDIIASMVCSLPLATASYSLPQQPLLDSPGKVNAPAYLYGLADIASRMLELDAMKSARVPLPELFNVVMRTDHELRLLANLPGKDWWNMNPCTSFAIDMVLQYWHKYFVVRTHLQLALTYDGLNEQFAYKFITCLDEYQELTSRYQPLRPAAPTDFFANWAIDMQAFTSVIFLQLTSYRISRSFSPAGLKHRFDNDVMADLIEQVVDIMETSTGRAGGDFAQQAASAIRSLQLMLKQSKPPESQGMSLGLPWWALYTSQESGIQKRYSAPEGVSLPQPITNVHQQSSGNESYFLMTSAAFASQSNPSVSDAMDFMDSFSYSMEPLESNPFLPDDDFSGWI